MVGCRVVTQVGPLMPATEHMLLCSSELPYIVRGVAPILYTQELRHKEIMAVSEPVEIPGSRDSEMHVLFAMDTTLQNGSGPGRGQDDLTGLCLLKN